MKHVIKLKKKKTLRLDWSKRESEKKFEKTFEYVMNTCGEAFYKTELSKFNRSRLVFNLSKK